MVMFTEPEVLRLRTLAKVSVSFLVDWLFENVSQCELEPEDLKAHYSSYLAAGHISVYNPVSVMSAFKESRIDDFWVATGLPAMIIFVLQPTE